MFPIYFQPQPAIAALSLMLIVAGIVLSTAIVRKLAASEAPETRWRTATLYLIPGLYGGTFAVMLYAWLSF